MCAKYGADTVRLYMLFAAPPEKDLDWSDAGIEGSSRFLSKIHRLVSKHAESLRPVSTLSTVVDPQDTLTAEERRLLRKAHQTLRHVTEDMEGRWHFNTDVALCMELVNELTELQGAVDAGKVRLQVQKTAIEFLVMMLSLFTPHIADELWQGLGHEEPLLHVSWPAFDRALAAEEELEMPVQVNGKLRARIRVAVNAGEEEVLALAQTEEKVIQHLAGKEVVKVIIVPQKLINIVAR
jgi:leucyl-tRNA synthetase